MSVTSSPTANVPTADGTVLRGPHRLACAMVAWCVFLLLAGANVTSTDSALSVPDWPLAYGTIFPDRWMEIATVRAELGHRYIATIMGMMTIALAVWLQLTDERRWVRRLGWTALGLVILQGVIGGVGVLLLQPWWWSVPHALGSQIYLSTIVVLAVVVSPWWRTVERSPVSAASLGVLKFSLLCIALLMVQLILGALGRHDAIPREVHAIFALPVVILLTKLVLHVVGEIPAWHTHIRRAAMAIGLLTMAQILFGLWTYMVTLEHDDLAPRTLAEVVPMNLHLVIGASILGLVVMLAARTVGEFGLPTDEAVAELRRQQLGAVPTSSGGGDDGEAGQTPEIRA